MSLIYGATEHDFIRKTSYILEHELVDYALVNCDSRNGWNLRERGEIQAYHRPPQDTRQAVQTGLTVDGGEGVDSGPKP